MTDNLPVNIEEQLKKQLATLNSRTGPAPSNKISTRGKKFTLPGGRSGTDLHVIVLDWRYVPAHYPGAYNPNQPQDPDCFAVGPASPDSGNLAPHESITKPHSDNCKTCPKNQWKSGAGGKGKACKNQVRLLVVPADASGNTDPMTLYVSPTAVKHWERYVNDLNQYDGLSEIQVVTHVTFDPNETYPTLRFAKLDKHANLNEMWALRQRHQAIVERPIELRNQKAA